MSHTVRAILLATAATAVMGVAAPTSGPAIAQDTIQLTFISGYPPTFTWPRAFVEHFAPEVDKQLAETGNYRINWNMAHSGTIARPRGELEAIETGLGDIGIVITPFHADRLPLYGISYVTPFTTTDVHLVQEMHAKIEEEFADEFESDWSAVRQIPLAATLPMDSYWVVSRTSLQSFDDLPGLKVSAAGLNLPWVTELGAAGIDSAATDWYMHLNTGLADAAIAWPDVTGTQKLCEPAKHVLHADIGPAGAHVLTVNADVWERLPDEVRQAFLAVAPSYAEYQADLVVTGSANQRELCEQEEGMQVVELSAEERSAWAMALPPMALNWAESLDNRGRPGTALLQAYMDGMRAAGAQPARDWDKE